MGPFAVVALVSPVAVRLVLTGKLQGLHPVFHVSLLCRYEPSGDGVRTPPPIIADEEGEYKVKALFAHRVQLGARHYLICRRVYNNSGDSWLSKTELEYS